MKKYIFLLSLFLIGCSPSYENIVNLEGKEINCDRVVKYWWGEKGKQPTDKEAKELCACYSWELKTKE